MNELPNLEQFSVADKDDLIRTQSAQIDLLTVQVTELTAKIIELEGRLSLNSRNSSKPPSTDGMSKPKPKSQRQAGQHPTGGQTGHSGHTLKKAAQPDHTEIHRPPARLATPVIAHWMAGRRSKPVRYSISRPCVTKLPNIR